jgi:hypothetical protein
MSPLRLLTAFALPLVIITTVLALAFFAYERNAVMPKEWLIARLTVAEAEARNTLPPQDDRVERSPELKKSFGTMNKEWERLKRRMQPGDELWTWEKRPWPGAGGIALVRNREVVEAIRTWLH